MPPPFGVISALHVNDPPPFSMRLQLLSVLQTPRGDIQKYFSIQPSSSSRELRSFSGAGSSRSTVSPLAMMAPVFEAKFGPETL
ncbi:hypothetical protein [Sorangium sp. So ce145]|uniref:hypothetical protein n=1 Tax=Sorangium sp. So ce145 TaxID=3133285 RepID=UPI003F5F9910